MTSPQNPSATSAKSSSAPANIALPNPLLSLHEQSGAELQPYAQTQIVSTFGAPEAEYAAIRKSCGAMDLPQRGLLELTGKDRLTFLNNLLTNELWNKETKRPMESGRAVYSFFLNTKGRILSDMTVLNLDDRTLLEMDGRYVPLIQSTLEKYLFAEQVKITSLALESTPSPFQGEGGGEGGDARQSDHSHSAPSSILHPPSSLHQFALFGPGSSDILKNSGFDVTEMSSLSVTQGKLFTTFDVIIYRDDQTASPGYFLIINSADAQKLWTQLFDSLGGGLPRNTEPQTRIFVDGKPAPRPPLRAVGWAAFNATRIEAGRPIFAIDFDDSVLPAETGQLDRAVSFTKGCYLGQEIVARMHARGQIARQIVGVKMESDALPIAGAKGGTGFQPVDSPLPIAGAKIFDDKDNEIGGITSSTISPVLSGAAIALGYIKKGFFMPGTRLRIPAEGAMHFGNITPLPFVSS